MANPSALMGKNGIQTRGTIFQILNEKGGVAREDTAKQEDIRQTSCPCLSPRFQEHLPSRITSSMPSYFFYHKSIFATRARSFKTRVSQNKLSSDSRKHKIDQQIAPNKSNTRSKRQDSSLTASLEQNTGNPHNSAMHSH